MMIRGDSSRRWRLCGMLVRPYTALYQPSLTLASRMPPYPPSLSLGKKREMYEHPVFCLASQVMDLTIREYFPHSQHQPLQHTSAPVVHQYARQLHPVFWPVKSVCELSFSSCSNHLFLCVCDLNAFLLCLCVIPLQCLRSRYTHNLQSSRYCE